MVDISFVILTHNSQETITSCLDSIRNVYLAHPLSLEIIVVDNGSADATVKKVQTFSAELPVKLLEIGENRGTTYTRNLAIKQAASEYICFLDSDAKLLEADVLKIIERLKSDKRIGIFAPRITLLDGETYASVKKFPTVVDEFIKLIYLVFLGSKRRIYKGDCYEDFPFDSERQVDTAISACWFFKKSLVEEIGYLDERIFFAPEDIEYCLRVRKAGKRIIYYPKALVLHHAQSISRANPFSMEMLRHIKGLLYMFLKHRYFLRRPKI